MAKTSHTVGIFSRDGQDNYNWLMSLLHLTLFRSVVKHVLPKYISNSFMEFEENVSECSFAILYHTLKRGRVNITDVTDSLYDDELKFLCQRLGKENVIVVIDDLTDSSDAQMREITRFQPSIERHACKLFLISEVEKESCFLEGSEWSEIATSDLLKEEHSSITAKRNQMKKILDSSSSHNIPSTQGSSNVFRRDGQESVSRRSPGPYSLVPSIQDSSNVFRRDGQDSRVSRRSPDLIEYPEQKTLMDPSKSAESPKGIAPFNWNTKVVLIIVSLLIAILIIALITISTTSV